MKTFVGILLASLQIGQPASQAPSTSGDGVKLLSPDPTDPVQKDQRDARSKLFKWAGDFLPLGETGGPTFYISTIFERFKMDDLPAQLSDAVIEGQVTEYNVFVAGNKQGLYTEFTVAVQKALKSTTGLQATSVINVLRAGGEVKVPNGRVIKHEIRGYGPTPAVGSTYLFFLTYIPAPVDAYAILKFWNIVDTSEPASKKVTAAFREDFLKVEDRQRMVDGQPLAAVEKLIQSSK